MVFRKIFLGLMFITLILFTLNPVTAAESVVSDILPYQDTVLFQVNPSVNYGIATEYTCGNPSGNFVHVLFQFEPLQKYIGISQAIFKLYCHNEVGGTFIINLHIITEEWDENTTTWSNPVSYSSLVNATLDTSTISSNWLEVDITNLVEAWANEDIPNYGFILEADHVTSGTYIQGFMENYPTESARPRITLTYDHIPEGSWSLLVLSGFSSILLCLVVRHRKRKFN